MPRFRSILVLNFVVAAGLPAQSQIHRLTLKEAIEVALKQNPDVVLARLEEQRNAQNLTIQKDPFSPKVFAGSGGAWSSGYPQSIDGNPPSILALIAMTAAPAATPVT